MIICSWTCPLVIGMTRISLTSGRPFFDHDTDTLYVKENSKWQPHKWHGRARPPQYFANHLAVDDLPATANTAANICPVVNVTHGACYSKDNLDAEFYYVPEPINPLEYNPASNKTLTDIKRVFELHCIAEKFLLDLCSLPADKCLSIAEGIRNGTCRAVLDGSFNLQRDCAGIAAFTVHASAEDNDPLTGTNWTTGTKADQGSYRSELGGVIAVLIAVTSGPDPQQCDLRASRIISCRFGQVLSFSNVSFN